MEEKMSNPKHRKENTNRNILIAVAAILLVIIIILLLHSCDVFGTKEPEPEVREPVHSGIAYDSAAVEGGWSEADIDSIVGGLNEKVEEGLINISMNTSPFFLGWASCLVTRIRPFSKSTASQVRRPFCSCTPLGKR